MQSADWSVKLRLHISVGLFETSIHPAAFFLHAAGWPLAGHGRGSDLQGPALRVADWTGGHVTVMRVAAQSHLGKFGDEFLLHVLCFDPDFLLTAVIRSSELVMLSGSPFSEESPSYSCLSGGS